MPPRQQQHDEARRHDPPAVAAADEQRPQQRQEERRGAQIGGPAGVGLFAPGGGKLLRRLRHAVGRQRRGDGAVLREGAGRVAAHEIGNQQVPALGTAVAPRRRIGQIQPAAPGIPGRQFRTAARGILRVLGGVPQRCEVRTERQQPCGRQHRRTFGEGFQEFLPQGDDAFAEPEQGGRQQEIVGDLRMVGADFERSEERRERSAPPRTPSAQRHPDAAHHRRRIDQRPHLGQVPRPDDEQEIGRKAVGQRRHDSHPRIDLHHAEHHPEGAHGKKDESGGDRHGPRQRYGRILDQLCGIAHVDQIGGHTAEHRTDPLRVFAVGLARPMDLAARPFVLTHIVLRQHVAAELGREIEGRQREEKEYGHGRRQEFSE